MRAAANEANRIAFALKTGAAKGSGDHRFFLHMAAAGVNAKALNSFQRKILVGNRYLNLVLMKVLGLFNLRKPFRKKTPAKQVGNRLPFKNSLNLTIY